VAEGFEPSRGRINSAVPYQLGYATKETRGWGDAGRGDAVTRREQTSLSPLLSVSSSPRLEMEAMKGVEPLSSGLQDRRSGIQLSYIAK
jgi:hypothetical protein